MYFHHGTEIIDSLFGISAGLIGAVGTLILAVVAIFGEQIKRSFYRPEIVSADVPIRTEQVHGNRTHVYHRVIVKNIGLATAKEVRVLLTYFDGGPENFLPIPLNWTHWNKTTRDISVGEQAYIDVLARENSDIGVDRFCWSHEVGHPTDTLLLNFNPTFGNLRLEFFGRDKKVGDVILSYSEKEDKLIAVD